MTVTAIQEAIQDLPAIERRTLASWLDELEQREWDLEMERDFSPDGKGIWLVRKAEADSRENRTVPLEEVIGQIISRRRTPNA